MPRLNGKLNILLVIIDLVGGAGVFTRNLAIGLRRYYGHELEVSLLMCRRRGLLPDDESNFDGIRVLDIPIGANPLTTIRAARAIGRAIADAKPDGIIAVHTFANLIVPLVAPRVPTL